MSGTATDKIRLFSENPDFDFEKESDPNDPWNFRRHTKEGRADLILCPMYSKIAIYLNENGYDPRKPEDIFENIVTLDKANGNLFMGGIPVDCLHASGNQLVTLAVRKGKVGATAKEADQALCEAYWELADGWCDLSEQARDKGIPLDSYVALLSMERESRNYEAAVAAHKARTAAQGALMKEIEAAGGDLDPFTVDGALSQAAALFKEKGDPRSPADILRQLKALEEEGGLMSKSSEAARGRLPFAMADENPKDKGGESWVKTRWVAMASQGLF